MFHIEIVHYHSLFHQGGRRRLTKKVVKIGKIVADPQVREDVSALKVAVMAMQATLSTLATTLPAEIQEIKVRFLHLLDYIGGTRYEAVREMEEM